MRAKKIFAATVSSTLIEVITAMIIISMVFSLAIVIYLNVQKSGLTSKRLSCQARMDEVYSTTLQTKKYEAQQVDFENMTIYQEVGTQGNASGLLSIRLEARDMEGKLLAEQKHLLYVPDKP